MAKVIIIDPANVPHDKGDYPTWEWKDNAEQLLFDIGFSYAMLAQAELMLEGLVSSFQEQETSAAFEANRKLRKQLGELLAKMKNFREKRFLADRDAVYEAGYALGKRFEAKTKNEM